MKVLIWTQYFWPENFHINAVARSLYEQGIEVTILTGKPNYPEGKIFEAYKATGIQQEKYSGFELLRIPLRQRDKNSGKGMVLNYLSFIASGSSGHNSRAAMDHPLHLVLDAGRGKVSHGVKIISHKISQIDNRTVSAEQCIQ